MADMTTSKYSTEYRRKRKEQYGEWRDSREGRGTKREKIGQVKVTGARPLGLGVLGVSQGEHMSLFITLVLRRLWRARQPISSLVRTWLEATAAPPPPLPRLPLRPLILYHCNTRNTASWPLPSLLCFSHTLNTIIIIQHPPSLLPRTLVTHHIIRSIVLPPILSFSL